MGCIKTYRKTSKGATKKKGKLNEEFFSTDSSFKQLLLDIVLRGAGLVGKAIVKGISHPEYSKVYCVGCQIRTATPTTNMTPPPTQNIPKSRVSFVSS